jgi:hypothetical protein
MFNSRSKFVLSLIFVMSFIVGSASTQLSAQQPQPANIAGNWTIYADNIEKAGSSLKTIQVTQNGSIITGRFKGPNQSGKIQGWINGNHVEFSTDTREVLTFRGEIQGNTMSGMYGINGRHAQWHAQLTN